MSWGAVATAIYSVLSADSSAGGLLHPSSDAYVTSADHIVQGQPGKDATFPIVTFQSTGGNWDDVFDANNRTIEYGIQVDVYTARTLGHTAHEPIVDRLKTLLRRVSLNVTGWVNTEVFLESEPVPAIEEGDQIHTVLIFRVHITDPS